MTSPWLSCDLAVTELWPRRDWAVTSPSRDWAVIIGPRSRDHRGHCELYFIFSWVTTNIVLVRLFQGLHLRHIFVYIDCFTVPTILFSNLCTFTNLGRGYLGVWRSSCWKVINWFSSLWHVRTILVSRCYKYRNMALKTKIRLYKR